MARDDLIRLHGIAIDGRGQTAVAQHGDALAQPEHLRQPVRHVEQRRSLLPQPAEDAEQVIRFGVGQCGGGFIENQNAALERQRPRDLEKLAMRRRQRLGERLGIDRQMQLIEQFAGACVHLAIAEAAERAELAAGEDVGADAEIGKRQHLLVDHPDAAPDRVVRRVQIEPLVVPVDSAGVGAHQPGKNLQQGGLAGAVLADDRVRRALGDIEADAVEGGDGTERLADVAERESHRRGILHLVIW